MVCHLLLERPIVARREIGRGGHSLHPHVLHAGDVLDQAADRQRADRGRGPGLLVGQAVGDRKERALIEVEELVKRIPFVGDGGRQSADQINIRFFELFHELPRIDVHGIEEAPLAFAASARV